MRLNKNRRGLDSALKDSRCRLLVLFSGDKAEAVYLKAKSPSLLGWRKVFLVENSSLLTLNERQEWGSNPDNYVALDYDKNVATKGSVNSLCLSSGKPSSRRIKLTFSSGNQE